MTLDVSVGRRLLAAATPREWEKRYNHSHGRKDVRRWWILAGKRDFVSDLVGEADADLIVWFHNHAAELLDAADLLPATRSEMEWARKERGWAEDARDAAIAERDALRAEVVVRPRVRIEPGYYGGTVIQLGPDKERG